MDAICRHRRFDFCGGHDLLVALPKNAAPNASKAFRASVRVDLGNAKVPRTFEVPPSYWGAILDPLSPAHVDDHPTKWEVYGDLKLKRKNGTSYFLMLSYDDRFAAGPTSTHRVYYRGSDNVALMRALEGAYATSQKH
jgi:hypothetical protein